MPSSFKRNFIASLFLAWATLTSAQQTYVEAPEVFYEQGYQVSVLDHCHEQGYIRPIHPIRRVCLEFDRGERVSFKRCSETHKREYFLSRPILEVQNIELTGDRIFTKVNRTKILGHEVEVYERERLIKSYHFDIPACEENLIAKENPIYHSQKATAKEALVYGALYQKGITLIDGESWTLEQVAHGRGYAPERGKARKGGTRSANLWYTSPNCQQGEIVPVEVESYLERLGGELTGSGRSLDGGELTGSGHTLNSGNLFVRLNVDQMSFSDLKYKEHRPFGIRHHLERFLRGEREIPKSLVSISCLKR